MYMHTNMCTYIRSYIYIFLMLSLCWLSLIVFSMVYCPLSYAVRVLVLLGLSFYSFSLPLALILTRIFFLFPIRFLSVIGSFTPVIVFFLFILYLFRSISLYPVQSFSLSFVVSHPFVVSLSFVLVLACTWSLSTVCSLSLVCSVSVPFVLFFCDCSPSLPLVLYLFCSRNLFLVRLLSLPFALSISSWFSLSPLVFSLFQTFSLFFVRSLFFSLSFAFSLFRFRINSALLISLFLVCSLSLLFVFSFHSPFFRPFALSLFYWFLIFSVRSYSLHGRFLFLF